MTSLKETLAVLSQAVPALPGKVEAVAHESDALERVAREALADLDQKRAQADVLMDQVRHALEALRDRADEESQHVEHAAQALKDLTGQEAHTVDERSDNLQAGGDEVGHAFDALQSELVHAGDRAHAAHEEARSALHGLGEQAHSSQTELDGAVHQMTAAIASAQEAVREGQAQVAEGVSALSQTMSRLLGEAHTRVQQTRARLDELHSEQERAVNDALSELEGQRGQLEQELTRRVESELEQPLDHELEAVAGALVEMGQHVLKLHADCSARRENLEQQFAAVADRIPPLQSGVEQVKGAAAEVGIAWP
jgi:chromosome segregation ATPase